MKEDYIKKINESLMGAEEIKAVEKVLQSGMLSRPEGGPIVRKFQEEMAQWLGKKYAYTTTTGTSSLHAAVRAIKLQPGDEIIVPALANIADCSVVLQEKGVPVFADIDPHDFNVSPESIKEKITPKTKAIIVVHMYGQPVKIDEIKKIASDHDIILIEDCAQAAGAEYKGKPVGSFGDISCFSLYQTKHIVCGEGGVVLTNNDEHDSIIRSISNNGIKRENLDDYDYDEIGYNYQLTEIQAAIAIEQLRKLKNANEQRRKNVEMYKELLSDVDIIFQGGYEDTENVYFYLAATLPDNLADKRDYFIQLAQEYGAPMKKLYPLPLTKVELLRKHNVDTSCPVAENITKRVFNLYVNPGLSKEDIRSISQCVRKAFEKISN